MEQDQKPKKPRNRREAAKYPALDKSLNLKNRAEFIDYDYVHKLSEEDKEYLNKFTEEYVNASFKKGKRHIQKGKEFKKESYDRNNARNRCQWSDAKKTGHADYLEDTKKLMTPNPETGLINKMDAQAQGYLDEDGQIIDFDILQEKFDEE